MPLTIPALHARRRGFLEPVALAMLLQFGMPAAAEQQSLRLGKMELAYDAARWRAEATAEGSVTMQPIGAIADRLDPVHVGRATGRDIDDCKGMARATLTGPMYEDPVVGYLDVAGVRSVRLKAPVKCRNAMPSGVAICVPYRGSSYTLSASHPGCRSGARNLFSGIDPLDELLRGVRFVP
jgi:hypothetical protein